MTDSLRIGNCSGFYGDRLSAMHEMLTGGPLDVLTGDYLAELTMLILGKSRLRDPNRGYATTFVEQLRADMATALDRGVRIVANAGGLNPAGCAAALRQIATEQGLDVRIAHVEGDDLLDRADEWGFGQPLTANAYLGAFGIARALDLGADIVVTGRVTDAALTLGPAISRFGWGRESYAQLAAGVVAGHVIECGAQACGGNYAGFTELTDPTHPGFPIAEIEPDGSFTVTKHPDTGGSVTVDTVTAQLVYEIAGPAYLNPDVTTHLDSVTLRPDGPGRVRVTGVAGDPPPPTTKVCLNEVGGFRNRIDFPLTGLDIDAKAALIRRQMHAAMSDDPPDVVEWRLERTDRPDPAAHELATATLRLDVQAAKPEPVGRSLSDAAVGLALASCPGFYLTAPPSDARPFGVYRPAYVRNDLVPHVVVLPDGARVDIPPPPRTREPTADRDQPPGDPDQPPGARPRPTWSPSTVSVPFGTLVHARSGDKGGDANVGVWIPADHPRRADAAAWLADFLTAERFRELIPEAVDLAVEVHRLPNLQAVNVVVTGILGRGVSASTRLDPQAKALGEWLRARLVDVPEDLVP